jgi:hypothetical protein
MINENDGRVNARALHRFRIFITLSLSECKPTKRLKETRIVAGDRTCVPVYIRMYARMP